MPLKYSRPALSLSRELEDVASDARTLSEYLRSPNALPESFPTVQVLQICDTLRGLPKGTAEGCRAPLEYARVRLPAIWREHILADSENFSPGSDDQPPALVRGMAVDRMLRDLIASVATALDEYRFLASAPSDNTVEAEPTAEVGADMTIAGAAAQAQQLENELGMAAHQLDEMAAPGSEPMEDLARLMRDAEGLTRVANAELRMRTIYTLV